MARYYQDISHFRAPYKAISLGADPGPLPGVSDSGVVNGVRRFANPPLVLDAINGLAVHEKIPGIPGKSLAVASVGPDFQPPDKKVYWASQLVVDGFGIILRPGDLINPSQFKPLQVFIAADAVAASASLKADPSLAWLHGPDALLASIESLMQGPPPAKKTVTAVAETMGPLAIGVGVAAVAGIGILAMRKGGARGGLATGKLTPNGKL